MKKQKRIREELVLIDGYYIPSQIVSAYEKIKKACLVELHCFFMKNGCTVKTMLEDDRLFLQVVEESGLSYRIDLSPQHISQLDKVVGTKKWVEYLEQMKEQR